MAVVSTIRLQHKRKKGKYLVVNLTEWASDLGKAKYAAYERVSETRGEQTPIEEKAAIAEAESNAASLRKDAGLTQPVEMVSQPVEKAAESSTESPAPAKPTGRGVGRRRKTE